MLFRVSVARVISLTRGAKLSQMSESDSTSVPAPAVPEKTLDAAMTEEDKKEEKSEDKKEEKKELRVRECPNCHVTWRPSVWLPTEFVINCLPTARGLWVCTNGDCTTYLFS